MSIRFPDVNMTSDGGSTSLVLTMPAAATVKPASTACVTYFWFRNRAIPSESGSHIPTLLTRLNGTSSGDDGYIRLNSSGDSISMRTARAGGTVTVAPAAIPVIRGRRYLVMHIIAATTHHFVVCEVGGTPTITSAGSASFFTNTDTAIWRGIGGAQGGTNAKAFCGMMEEVNFHLGTFPEVASLPDATLIANIANGTTDPVALNALLNAGAGGTHQARYRLRDETDLASAVGSPGPAVLYVPGGQSAATGYRLYTGGPARPSVLMPNFTRDAISQVTFATPGLAATATADIRVEGGTYSGLPTLNNIQARLLDESQTVVRDWTTLPSTAPVAGAGTWGESTPFSGVLMQASYLRVEFRARDSGGTVLATETGYGLRGAGFHAITQAQSQLMFMFENGNGLALPSGIRFYSLMQKEAVSPQSFGMLASGDLVLNRLVGRGIRQMAVEINARFPGVPIQIDTFGQAGTAINEFIPAGGINTANSPGARENRPAYLRDNLGVVQPYYMMYMGHSEAVGSDYTDLLALLVTHVDTNLGQAIRNLHISVPRYQGGGTDDRVGGNAQSVQNSRRRARNYVIANPARNSWMGSWSTVQTDEEPNAADGPGAGTPGFQTSPHPSDRDLGQGRSGGMMGWALMSASRAVPDVPLGISAVRAVGADAVIEFGAVNP